MPYHPYFTGIGEVSFTVEAIGHSNRRFGTDSSALRSAAVKNGVADSEHAGFRLRLERPCFREAQVVRHPDS